MTVLALCDTRGKSNFTQYRLSTSKLRNGFSTVSKYNLSFGILGKTCFIASPIFFILAIDESFFICLSLSISRSSFLHLSAASRLCFSSLNSSCAISSLFFSIASDSCLFLSLRIPYSPFLLSLLLLLCVPLLLFFSQHFLRLLSPFPELKPLLPPLLFSQPLSFPVLDFLILV